MLRAIGLNPSQYSFATPISEPLHYFLDYNQTWDADTVRQYDCEDKETTIRLTLIPPSTLLGPLSPLLSNALASRWIATKQLNCLASLCECCNVIGFNPS